MSVLNGGITPDADHDAALPLGWLRRALAFLVDSSIIGIVAIAFDNAIPFPIPVALSGAGAMVLFCLYFAVFEGRGQRRASLGRRLFRAVVTTPDGTDPTMRATIGRAVIVGGIVSIDWTTILLGLFGTLPFVALVALLAVQISLILWNASLAFLPQRSMIQDLATGTQVVRRMTVGASASQTSLPAARPRLRRPVPVMAASLAIILVLATAAVSIVGGRVGLLQTGDGRQLTRDLEERVWRSTGTRSRIELKTWYWTSISNGQTSRYSTLDVNVWIPAIAWRHADFGKIAGEILPNIRVTPGFYRSGKLKFWTGGTHLNFAQSFPLNVPPA